MNSLNVLLLKENISHLKIHNILSLMSSSELKYSKHIITKIIYSLLTIIKLCECCINFKENMVMNTTYNITIQALAVFTQVRKCVHIILKKKTKRKENERERDYFEKKEFTIQHLLTVSN